jgi:PhzF family phenazine biosynthesis protein
MRQWTIDAFADRPFVGNPACVVEPFEIWPADGWMQALAMENNQSETAFLRRTVDPSRFDLRWFTPAMEVDLCGHATLAAGAALMTEIAPELAAVSFDTRSGRLTVRKIADGFEMDLPADPPRRTEPVEGLAEALGAEPVEVWAARYLVVLLPDAGAVRACAPDFKALARLQGEAGEGGQVVIAALSDQDDVEVIDRFFGPGCGIDEDPATGSAHCILAPLYADRLGRPVVRFRQVYPGRGALFETEVAGDRVLIRGQAITVIESRLRPRP